MSDSPLVSIILPAYNAAIHLPQTLSSLAAQTYANCEIFIVDDGSTDDTLVIAQEFAERHRRVQILSQANRGVAAARNRGIEQSRGEWIAPIDADDIWQPQKIERQLERGLSLPSSVGLVYSWSLDIDGVGKASGDMSVSQIEGWVMPTLLAHNFLGNASSPLIRRSCLEAVGLYDTRYRDSDAQGCEDWDLSLRIAEKYQFAAVPEFHVGYRKTPGTMSGDYARMARSHALLLDGARARQNGISEFVFRMSRGNLFTYFARNSNARGDYRQALHWLGESLKSDKFTPFLRLTLYQLLVGSLWGLVRRRGPRSADRTHPPEGAEKGVTEAPAFPQMDSTWAVQLELRRARLFHEGVKLFSRGMRDGTQ